MSWLALDKAISIRVLTGGAGSGKTRLALELCDRADRKEWDAGFVTDAELDPFFKEQNLVQWGWRRPTLIVIDYAAARSSLLSKWLVELADHPGHPQKPLRLLLLERHADASGGWWREAFGRGGWDAEAVRDLLDPTDGPVRLPSLSATEERYQIFRAMLEQTNPAAALPELHAHTGFGQRLAQLSWGGDPLFLMMAGLMAARVGVGEALALSRSDLAFRLADRELNRIEQIARRYGLREGFLSHLAAYVTLCQGLTRMPLEEAIEEEKSALRRQSAGDAHDVAEALAVALPSETGGASPILPDVIGEAAILRLAEVLEPDRQAAWIGRAFRHAPTQVAASVIRTAQDYAIEGYSAPLLWLDHLAHEGEANLAVLIDIVNQLPINTLVLRERSAQLASTLVTMARPLVEAEGRVFAPLLGSALTTLTNSLSALGRREAALQHAQEAVDLYRQLAAERPDAFRPDLAASLNILANRLSDLGRREEALQHAQEAVATLSSFFLTYSLVFSQQMATMARNYLRFAQELERAPDMGLLQPIIDVFQASQQVPAEEPPENGG